MWTVVESSADMDARFARFGARDAYHCAGFHEYDRNNGYGEICQYWYEDERGVLFHPFMLRRITAVGAESITEPLFDVETVKGLAGPLASSRDPAFLAAAWRGYEEWCTQKRVVAEYVRFNPFLGNAACGGGFFEIFESARLGVVLDMSAPEERIWTDSYDVNQRNMVRKALRLGVECRFDESQAAFAAFVRLQRESWTRLGARKDRHFPESSLCLLRERFGSGAPLFVARMDGGIVAAALFLVRGELMHYELSARDPRAGSAGATNLLLHTAAMWARENGVKLLHLGAGRTASADDELLRFKRSLSPRRISYPVGVRRHLPEAFDRLVRMWQRQAPGRSLADHSMPYREPLGSECLESA